jgi:predicted nucleic acid-binding protein
VAAIVVGGSARVPVVQRAAAPAALRTYLGAHPTARRVTSVLSRTEVLRAAWAGGALAQQQALILLEQTDQVALTRAVLDQASALLPGVRLRTLDAIHLACALALGGELRTPVTYDIRLAQAAAEVGLVAFAPA